MALSVKNRLSKKRDFDTVFKEGKIIKGSFLFIKVADNGGKMSRFGFVISSKISGKAVIRNKLRRELSDFIRLNMNKIRVGYDIMVVIRNGTVGASKLREDLKSTLIGAKIICQVVDFPTTASQ